MGGLVPIAAVLPLLLLGASLGLPDAGGVAGPDREHVPTNTYLPADDVSPTVALVPVGSTGPYVIVGNEILIPDGGVAVELELWAYNLQQLGRFCIRSYHVTIDSAGYSTGTTGTLTPAQIPCQSDEDCRGEAVCTNATCDVRAAGFIDWQSPSWLFYNLPAFWTVDHQTPNFRYGAVMLDIALCPFPSGGYLGTLVLDVSDDASRAFVVGFIPYPETFVKGPMQEPIPSLVLRTARITLRAYSSDDIVLWTACVTGPVPSALEQECLGLDVNADGAIDLRDFTAVQILFRPDKP